MTTAHTTKRVATSVALLAAMLCAVAEVEGHISISEHLGSFTTSVESQHDSTLNRYTPKLTINWSLSGSEYDHDATYHDMVIRVTHGIREVARYVRSVDPHKDYSGTYIVTDGLAWNHGYHISLNTNIHRDTSWTATLASKHLFIGAQPTNPVNPDPEDTDPPTPTTPVNPDPEDTDPETPVAPEPPPPASSACTFEHRLLSVPTATAAGYSSRIMVSSSLPNATATIRAYKSSDGSQLDMYDAGVYSADPEDATPIGNPVRLNPAHSTKRFMLGNDQGWHKVIVQHPSARLMHAATVVMRMRWPGVGVTVIPAVPVEYCPPSAEPKR